MSNLAIQPELFVKYLPEDLVRYMYSFVYRDVKVNLWRYKYDMYDILNNLYYYWGDQWFGEKMVEAFTQHFPGDLHRILGYFKLERERIKGHGWVSWYEMPYEADDSYYNDLFNEIIEILDEKTPDEVYGLLSGWVLMNNQITANFEEVLQK
jgi:hypothetical protein